MSMYAVTKESFPKELNQKMLDRVQNCINRVWNCIASDVFECDGSTSISRAGMLEVCMDANRMEDYDAEAGRYAIWLSNHYPTEWKRQIKILFPYSRY